LLGGGEINPNFLPRDPTNGCAELFPRRYLKVNTIFEVVKANGGTTAWIPKHPSYEWTNGPSGKASMTSSARKSNSNPVALPQFPGCNLVPFVDNTLDDKQILCHRCGEPAKAPSTLLECTQCGKPVAEFATEAEMERDLAEIWRGARPYLLHPSPKTK
jgi:hypothetical protein